MFIEKQKLGPKSGYIFGVLKYADGSEEYFEDHVEDNHNLIVNTAGILAASAMKGDFKITHMAVGTGIANEAVEQKTLTTEIKRVPVTITVCGQQDTDADTHKFNIVDPPASDADILTNKIMVRGEFGTDVVGALTEIALFGGPNAANTNGGIMVNRKRFDAWTKPVSSVVSWNWVLVF
jgi:hypothetical protein